MGFSNSTGQLQYIFDYEELVHEEVEKEVNEEEEETMYVKLMNKRHYYQQFVDMRSLDHKNELDVFTCYILERTKKLERAETTSKPARIINFTNQKEILLIQ